MPQQLRLSSRHGGSPTNSILIEQVIQHFFQCPVADEVLIRAVQIGQELASGRDDGVLCLWELESGRRRSLPGHDGRIMHIAWSADGAQVATAGDNHTLRTWDTVSSNVKFVMSGHREVIFAVEFSRDSRRLLSGDARGTIKLWDVATGVETLTLRGSIGQLAAAGWSPDGKRIFGNCDGKI